MKKLTFIFLVLLDILVSFSICFAKQQEIAGKIDEVVVYRGQALITRIIEVELPAGTSEIIVPNLPNRIVSESLFAQSHDDSKVISVRYREKTVKEDTRQEVKELEAKIEDINKQIYVIDRNRQHTTSCWSRYNKLWELSMEGEQKDLNRGLLQPEALSTLTEYLEDKSIYWHDTAVRLEQEKKQLEKELEQLNKKFKNLRSGRSSKQRQAVIFIESPAEANSRISLSYLVNNASWLPQYNLRALPEKEKMLIEYNAVIHQSSGENWDGVQVALSTAQPTTEAGAPVLDAMKIRLLPRQISQRLLGTEKLPGTQSSSGSFVQQEQWRDLTEDFDRLQKQRRNVIAMGISANDELGQLAMDNQMIELRADDKRLRMIKQKAKVFARNEGVSVAYNLSGRLTMPSRSDQQLVTITSFETDADFVFIATPLLTDYVYLQGQAKNNSDTLLLAGTANMYRDGQFAGKGYLELVPVGKKFTVGFGVESRIQVIRELEDKEIENWLGNSVENYTYRIALNNYSDHKVKLRLMDRMPYTEDENLGISDFTTTPALSTDSEYLRVSKENGILRWDLTLEPDSFDDTATIVTYKYTLKYDNDMHISAIAN